MDDVAVEIAKLDQRQSVSEHRISDLEGELKDIRQLTTAVVQVNDKVDNLKTDVGEIKDKVEGITARPGKWWDKIVSAALGAAVTGLVAALLTLIIK